MKVLKELGCGFVMLRALASLYKVSKSILSLTIITAVIGVRQGSPMSCLIFIMYVKILILWLKRNHGWDGYLKWLHCLMLMDDTVILASTRERCIEKVKTLLDYCGEYEMIIKEKKTKFMVIGKHVGTIDPLVVTSSDQNHICKIEYCESYTYLGCIFTNDGRTRTAIKSHVEDKKKHLLKLIMFFAKNPDMPFSVKLKLAECESKTSGKAVLWIH